MFFAKNSKFSAEDSIENVQKKSLQDTFINDVMHLIAHMERSWRFCDDIVLGLGLLKLRC